MYKSAIFALISLTFGLEIDEKLFINDELPYPKCCPRGQVYNIVNTKITCVVSLSELLVSNVLRYHTGIYPCLDAYYDGFQDILIRLNNRSHFDHLDQADYITYPKCCPMKKSYSSSQGKCVLSDHNSLDVRQTPGLILKYGLSNCIDDINLIRNVYNFTIDEDKNARSNDGSVFPLGRYCFEYDVDSKVVMLRTCNKKKDFCNDEKKCFPKCCRDGQIMIDNNCTYSFEHAMNVGEVVNGSLVDDYLIYQHYERDADGTSRDVTSAGKIYMSDNYTLTESGVFESLNDSDYDVSHYCVEFVRNHGTRVFYYLDKIERIQKIRYILHSRLFIVSVVCLILTIACYLSLPKMNNLYGKCIITYCFILAVMLSFLYHMHTVPIINGCAVIGLFFTFLILSSYAWLNVICFDMWMTFGHIKAISTDRRAWKRYFYYHLYGTVMPAVIILFSGSVYAWDYLPSGWVPHFEEKCTFTRGSIKDGLYIIHYDYYLFYITPSIIFITINLVLFAKTIRYCFKVKNDIHKMNDNTPNMKEKKKKIFIADKEKMLMFLKLFVITGILWVAEVLTSAVDVKKIKPLQIISIIFDAFTASQGIFIFCILILKKNVLKALKKRFNCFKTEQASDKSVTTTLSADTNSGSHTNSGHNMITLGATKTDNTSNNTAGEV